MSSTPQTTAADDGLLILVETRRTTSRSERIRALALYIALAAVVTLGVVGIAIQLIPSTRHLYIEQDLTATFLPPFSPGHPLGTDNLGRDLGWRIVAGLGVSLTAGLAVAVISSVLGLIGGILGAFYGRTADTVASVCIDVSWAFPAILLAVVLAGALGPGMVPVILGISLTGWAAIARIVRGEVLSLREREYVAAAPGARSVALSGQPEAPAAEPAARDHRAGGIHCGLHHGRRGGALVPRSRRTTTDAVSRRDHVGRS